MFFKKIIRKIGNRNIDNNIFIDKRDNEKYKTRMFNGKIWMIENFRFNIKDYFKKKGNNYFNSLSIYNYDNNKSTIKK